MLLLHQDSLGRPAHAAWLLLLALLPAAMARAEIIDRVVAVVGNHAVTSGEVDRQLALQALIERQPLTAGADAAQYRAAMNRLIDRQLVKQEREVANFPPPDEREVAVQLDDLRHQRFWNGLNFEDALKAHGLDEQDVRDFLRETLIVLDFIDFRFKTGLQVAREEITAYYKTVYAPELGQAARPLDQVAGQIEEIVRERIVETLVDEWLNELRLRTRVSVLDGQAMPRTDPGE